MSISKGQYRHLVTLGADVASTASTAFQDITGLSFAVANAIKYRWQATIIYTTSVASIGLRVSHTGPATTLNAYMTQTGITVSGSLTLVNWTNAASATDTGTTSTASLNTTAGNLITAWGFILPSAAGTFQLRFAPETATASGIIIKAGSTLEWW